jgi:glycosyltransferase involved in cell wall biosynthesis
MDASKCFQIHKTKFKGVIAVSNWQKNNIVTKLNTPADRIIVSRNAIYPERFVNKNVEKIPYRFIYTSDPSRGLSNLIDVLPKIKERYPLTTLYIFAISENIDDNTMNKIKQLDYVFLSTRLSQDEIANEFLKSDIWFYPTDFKETYCITAVEAMCSKCLVCTINLGALKEIVMGKGILCDYPINNEKMLNKIFFVLEKQYLKKMFIEKAYDWAIEQTFDKLAKDWKTNLLL